MPRPLASTDLIATVILFALAVGLALRHRRNLHPWIMGGCFLADLGLVLYLETTRGAVATAAKLSSGILNFHVAVAVATLVLYLVLIPSGWKILNGGGSRLWHQRAAWAFVVVRLATYLTAFFVPRSV